MKPTPHRVGGIGVTLEDIYLVLWPWHPNLLSYHPVQLDERMCRSGHTGNGKHEITALRHYNFHITDM